MKKKVLITCAVVLGVILAVYLGFAFYFSSHYLFNTKINSVKYAGKTAKEAIEKNTALSRDYLDVGILRIFNVVITENVKSLELFRQSGIVIFGRTL